MATEFHNRVQRLIEQALEVRTTLREGWIGDTCAADTRLRREALALLPHYLRLRQFEPQRPRGSQWRMPGTTTLRHVQAETEKVASEPELRPPFCLDHYTVVETIGRGGMGIVYRAVLPTTGRRVAIKLLRRRPLDGHERWRFMFEEEILRQLRHPGIARFIHSGIARLRPRAAGSKCLEERPYFVMEYVAGEPLTRFAAARGLDARARLELLVKVCDAVAYAHQRGVVHCDLKPENILVDDARQPKVLDFGIARLTACEAATRPSGQGVGCTLPYASPEQLLGRADQITPRSDVYALGLIAHELLTGCRPEREGWALRLRLDEIVVDPSRAADDPCNARFRYHVQSVLATALRQTRTRRYTHAAELGEDVAALVALFAAPSRWSSLKNLIRGNSAAEAAGGNPLGRPLSAVLRKRIGMAVDGRKDAGR